MGKYWKIVEKVGKKNVAWVYLLSSISGQKAYIECVDAFDPRYPARQKWVIILSSQKGCPVKCRFCDAAFYYGGNLSREELLEQLEIVIFPHKKGDDCLKAEKIKLHFARMGEPALNPAVLEVLDEIPFIYPGLAFVPTIATLAPAGTECWFEKLTEIKDKHFTEGRFQLQLSLNSTDESYRDRMMPVKKWPAEKIGDFGRHFYRPGDRKITLNYALAKDTPFEAQKVIDCFDPGSFLVKITPLNPTRGVEKLGAETALKFDGSYPEKLAEQLARFQDSGFEVIISIGSLEEIEVGSNCGQLAFRRLTERSLA
jgi:23S rRNA (adenine2503-C2)-methyltransferase